MDRLIECVPNISEGRDAEVLRQVAAAVESVEGVMLLDVDPGAATNRTVFTFVGEPEPVLEAAFRLAAKTYELVDMAGHSGEHPRFGALDVCPLVPVSGLTLDEVVPYAEALGRRLGEELGVPVFLYERAARTENRRNLANIRAGEYERLAAKLADPEWRPDFGPTRFDPRKGAVAVGARDFLIAYNVNLNTTSTRRANSVAFDVREKGRVKREGDPLTGKPILDEQGRPIDIPGSLKAVKAIGWFIEEYGIAQISMNLTDIGVTPMHVAFDEVCRKAEERGLRVTGSEIVGLVPLRAMLDAGKYFLRKQRRSVGVSEAELVKIAVRSLGLGDLKPFRPEEKIVEYALAARRPVKRLIDLTAEGFAQETAGESPAPGGGSVSALVGALGAALGAMVANLSSHKRGWDDRWEEFSDWAETGQAAMKELLRLVDADTAAFNALMHAFGLPQRTDVEKQARSAAIQSATRQAIETPLAVVEAALECFDLIEAMARDGNPNSASDAGVGALCVRAAVRGAALNVRINAGGLKDESFRRQALDRTAVAEQEAARREQSTLALVAEAIAAS